MFEEGQKLDWSTGEALAFGSLLYEGPALFARLPVPSSACQSTP